MHYKTEQEIMRKWKEPVDAPIVSICCTTYNHGPYIAEAIESFLMQETDFVFEILIRDDCSTDHTSTLVKEYTDKYPTLIKPIFEKENTYSKGVKPMLQLYKVARAKYIALCEGDDYWTDPLKLQKQVDFLEQNDDYVITYTSVEAFDENGLVNNYTGGVTRDVENIELQKTIPINTLTTCFRNVIKEVPKEFDCTKYGDLFTWSILGTYGKGKYLADIKPARYRIHDGGIHSKKEKHVQLEMWSLTAAALYSYHSRMQNTILAEHFKSIIFELRLKELSPIQILKHTYKEIRHRIKYYLKSLLKKNSHA